MPPKMFYRPLNISLFSDGRQIDIQPYDSIDTSVIVEREDDSDDNYSINAVRESPTFQCEIKAPTIESDFKAFMGWDGDNPPQQHLMRGVTLKVDMRPTPIRSVNEQLYQLRLRRATSIRKAKKYAKILGYHVVSKTPHKIEFSSNRYLICPECKLDADWSEFPSVRYTFQADQATITNEED